MTRVFVAAGGLLASCGAWADAADGEIFGIRMGQPLGDLQIERQVSEVGYVLKSVPKPDPLFQDYRVTATHGAGVCSVVAVSRFANVKDAIKTYNQAQDRLFAAYGTALYQDLSHRTSDETLMWTPRGRTAAVTLTLVRSNPAEKRVSLVVLFANRDACDRTARERSGR